MKEALKLALEALENINNAMPFPVGSQAITAIKEALAQPEQKPVAWRHKGQPWEFKTDYCINFPNVVPYSWEPLYTTPPQRKPLTDEMVLAGARALAKRHADSCGLDFDDVWKYYAEEHKDDAKAVIEAAHGIKGGA